MALFDASSIQAAVRRLRGQAAQVLEGGTALDLTLYELGNVIWKENRVNRGEPLEAVERVKALQRLLSIMEIRRIDLGEMAAIAENASMYGLTFYDSAYLTAALTTGMSLVTEDSEILRASEEAGLEALPLDRYLKPD